MISELQNFPGVAPEITLSKYKGGNWNFPDDDPFPEMPLSVGWQLVYNKSHAPQLNFSQKRPGGCWGRDGRWWRRWTLRVVTGNGALTSMFAYASDRIWVGTAIVIAAIWSGYLDEHIKRVFYYNTDTPFQAWNGFAWAISATAAASFFQWLVYSVPWLWHRWKTTKQRMNRVAYTRLIKFAREHDPYIMSRDWDYDSDTEPLRGYAQLVLGWDHEDEDCSTPSGKVLGGFVNMFNKKR